MLLTPNTKLGPYEVLSSLGAGGMGEVYRARDSRLDRDVAIKLLPETFARDTERMARFQREAKVLASLSHTNIAAVYGFEEFEGKRFLVMELAEGETLAERLQRGPLPIRDSLEIASLVAQGVEAAHEKGIIHRDLKPANVKVTAEGVLKVLDFGLAKALTGDTSATDIANSPTITVEHTRPGVVLGTAAYMSPEQARGRVLDKRTDIWSFGVILYECLTAQRPFIGETTSDLVARILERDPDWTALPKETPPLVQLLLRRCLAKDRNKRLRDIGDARVDLEAAIHDPTTSGWLLGDAALRTTSSKRERSGAWMAVSAVFVAILGVASGWALRDWRASTAPRAVIRFVLDFPASYSLTGEGDGASLALDPTGGTLAFAAEAKGISRIFVRELSADEARPMPGTEGGKAPFFSPDGRWLGFSAGGKLMKVPVAGGPSLSLCDKSSEDAAWLDDGTIVFGGERSLVRVSENGGTPQELAVAGPTKRAVDGQQLLLGFQTVCAVPGASYVLAGVWDGVSIQDYDVVSVSLSDGAVRSVMQNAVDPHYVAPGYLVFLRGTSVLAVPFDERRGVVQGEPFQVIEGVVASKWADQAKFATSTNGTLAFVPGGRPGPGRRLIRVDSNGKAEPLMDGVDAMVGGILVSPSGRDVAVVTLRRQIELWSFSMSRQSFTLVNNTGETWGPVWTSDGESLVFQRTVPEQEPKIVQQRADGSGPAEPISIEKLGDANPSSFSPDGSMLFMTRNDDVILHRWGQTGPPELILGTSADEGDAMFAPDGKHFAYVSNESSRDEVFVRTIPDSGRKWQVSTTGGYAPRWSRDGKTLFFLDDKGVLHASSIETDSVFHSSSPQRLFDTNGIATTDLWGAYDVLPDGSFVMVEPADWEKQPSRIHIVVNWVAELPK